MSWPARTWVAGELVVVSYGNGYIRDPLTDLRAGGIAIASQAAGDFIRASSSTQWARLAKVNGQYPSVNGSTVWEMANAIANANWPVGAIYETTRSENPNDLLGIGTWTLWGVGRVMVAIDAGQVEFDTLDETGGSKTHSLTTTEIPSHNHTQDSHTHTQDPHSHTFANMADTQAVDEVGTTSVADNSGTKTTSSTTATNNAATATNNAAGGGAAHQNMQPSIVINRWKRTA